MPPSRGSPLEVLGVALRLGLTSFGGPVAHIGYFRAEYVVRRGWVDEATFADLVALCQFLPGPASSKVGIGLGILRAGLLGGLSAWLGFTLPSALALTLFAFGVGALGGADAGVLHGLKVVAVAVVAQAVWAMARSLAPDRERATIALAAAVATLAWPTALGQVATIALAGLVGWRLLPREGGVSPGETSDTSDTSEANSNTRVRPSGGNVRNVRDVPAGDEVHAQEAPWASRTSRSPGRPDPNPPHASRGDPLPAPTPPRPAPPASGHPAPGTRLAPVPAGYPAPGEGMEGPRALVPFGRRTALVAWGLFFGLLLGLPLLRAAVPSHAVELVDTFYRVGSLVFGGGHVILPLLQAEVVPPGWVTREQFVAGYGAAQAVPGPLFTFSAYLGATMAPEPNGWVGAGLALVAIFVPSFLLVVGSLPFWDALRSRPAFQDALRGINAAVVGLLLAALYQPVWVSAILGPTDFALALAALGLLALWKLPPWLVVLLAAGAGALPGLL